MTLISYSPLCLVVQSGVSESVVGREDQAEKVSQIADPDSAEKKKKKDLQDWILEQTKSHVLRCLSA